MGFGSDGTSDSYDRYVYKCYARDLLFLGYLKWRIVMLLKKWNFNVRKMMGFGSVMEHLLW